MIFVAEGVELKYDRLCLVPIGGQSEIGRCLWVLSHSGELLLVDAGACYPGTDLPGVDLLLPNTSFLEANQERISALILTNGNEEHCGAVAYLLEHLKIPRIMAPRFVAALLAQRLADPASSAYESTTIDTVETRQTYQIGSFQVEWIQVNDAIADACALKIGTPEGNIIYTSSFKLDQTPIDGRQMDIARIAEAGDSGVTLLLSDSAGVETSAYTPSEKAVARGYAKHIGGAAQRVIVVLPGTNTPRLQLLFDLAKKLDRRIILFGETLIQTAVAAAITGNLSYDRKIEANLSDLDQLEDSNVLIVATGEDGDAMSLLTELAYNQNKELSLKRGDTVIFSSEIYPGESRKMAMIQDQFLSNGITAAISTKHGVHVSNHAGREELKLMLSLAKPRYFLPMLGEGRHIMHHAQLAQEFGVPSENIFPLKNGEILEIYKGVAGVIGSVEAQAVFFNRGQADSVTAFSVNERRSLSMEGMLNVVLLLGEERRLVREPLLDGVALGFLHSDEWSTLKDELIEKIGEWLKEAPEDITAVRSYIRDLVSKAVRSRLGSKPIIQVVIHELATSRPE